MKKEERKPEIGDVWRHTSLCEIVIEDIYEDDEGFMVARCVRDGIVGWSCSGIVIQTLPLFTIKKHYHYVGKFKGFEVEQDDEI